MGFNIKVEENNTKIVDFSMMEEISSNNKLLERPYRDIKITVLEKDSNNELLKFTLILLQEDNIVTSLTHYDKKDKSDVKLIKEALKQLIVSDKFTRDINDYDILTDYKDIYSGIIYFDSTSTNFKDLHVLIGMILDDLDKIVYEALRIYIRCLVIDIHLDFDRARTVNYLQEQFRYEALDTHLIDDKSYTSVIRDYMDDEYIK